MSTQQKQSSASTLYCLHDNQEMPLTETRLDESQANAEMTYKCPQCNHQVLVRVNISALSDYMFSTVAQCAVQAITETLPP